MNTKDGNKGRSLPDYGNPPVIEVVCGLVFEKLEKFRAPHLGLFWQKIRNDFPTCQHAPTLGFPPDPPEFFGELPLPRVWYINEHDDRLIQLQNDRFFYNWRRIQPDDTYPRYATIIEAFKANLNILEKFFNEESLGSIKPVGCELSYINHIPKGDGWDSLFEINNVFPDLAWHDTDNRFLPVPVHWGWDTQFALPEDRGNLLIKLRHQTRKVDKLPFFNLHIEARGLGGDKSWDSVWKWFDLAHEWIVLGFTDLTNSKVQNKVWKRLDVETA